MYLPDWFLNAIIFLKEHGQNTIASLKILKENGEKMNGNKINKKNKLKKKNKISEEDKIKSRIKELKFTKEGEVIIKY